MNEDDTHLDNHPVFTDLHTFVKQLPGSPPEQAEVDHYIWSQLPAANIKRSEVNVHVKYVDTQIF